MGRLLRFELRRRGARRTLTLAQPVQVPGGPQAFFQGKDGPAIEEAGAILRIEPAR